MSEQTVLVEQRGWILLLILNRPNVANCLNLPTLLQLRATLEEFRFDPLFRAVVITGSGGKAFCAGADLKERQGMTMVEVRRYVRTIRQAFDEVAAYSKPVIAAINGQAFGGGLELALACDIRVAAEGARMGLTECTLGIIPGAGGTQRLTRLVGPGRAKELILSGRRVGASEALAMGLVERLVPAEALLSEALDLAGIIAANAPRAVEQAKFAIDRGSQTDLATGLELEAKAYETLLPTRDRLEGLAAFAEKRKPQYVGE